MGLKMKKNIDKKLIMPCWKITGLLLSKLIIIIILVISIIGIMIYFVRISCEQGSKCKKGIHFVIGMWRRDQIII